MRDGNDKVNLELVEDMKLHPGTLVRLIFFSEAESGVFGVCWSGNRSQHSPDHLEVD